jgi:hypothetical protein
MAVLNIADWLDAGTGSPFCEAPTDDLRFLGRTAADEPPRPPRLSLCDWVVAVACLEIEVLPNTIFEKQEMI